MARRPHAARIGRSWIRRSHWTERTRKKGATGPTDMASVCRPKASRKCQLAKATVYTGSCDESGEASEPRVVIGESAGQPSSERPATMQCLLTVYDVYAG